MHSSITEAADCIYLSKVHLQSDWLCSTCNVAHRNLPSDTRPFPPCAWYWKWSVLGLLGLACRDYGNLNSLFKKQCDCSRMGRACLELWKQAKIASLAHRTPAQQWGMLRLMFVIFYFKEEHVCLVWFRQFHVGALHWFIYCSPITFSTGRYANLADGAALVQVGSFISSA